MWLVAGADKATALRDLMEGADIPARCVARDDALIYADRAAGSRLSH